MTPAPASRVRVAHIVTWSARDGVHEDAVNARLADLPGNAIVIDMGHSASMAPFEGDIEHQFSTLITYFHHDTEDD